MIRKLVDNVNAAAAVVLGLYFLLLKPFGIAGWTVSIAERPWLWLLVMLIGLVFLAGGLWYIAVARRGGEFSRNLRITTEGGASSFSLAALEHELESGLGRESDLSGIKVTLEPQENGLPTLCHLRFKTSARQDLPGRVDRVKKLARDMFLAMFPAGMGLEIYADVVNFTGGAAKTPAAEGNGKADAAAAVEPAADGEADKGGLDFSGPRYPEYDHAATGAESNDPAAPAEPTPADGGEENTDKA